jgi:serine/threonine protein kinase
MEDITVGRYFGSYRITEPIGEGGMASVYRAYQESVGRYVAIKVLSLGTPADKEFIGRFQQEAKVLANLQHPNILPIHDFGEEDGYAYIVMPLIETGTLADKMKGAALDLNQAYKIIFQVGDALDYAHSQGLIHRDIKPSNILIDKRGNSMLTDFGIAKLVESSSEFTKTGGVLGTPAYMSPEQGTGQDLDHRSDIYSLGIVFFEMVTGKQPFEADTPIATIFKHVHDPPPNPSAYNKNVPREVADIITKALEKSPDSRFATIVEMTQALTIAFTKEIESKGGDVEKTLKEIKTTPKRKRPVMERKPLLSNFQIRGLARVLIVLLIIVSCSLYIKNELNIDSFKKIKSIVFAMGNAAYEEAARPTDTPYFFDGTVDPFIYGATGSRSIHEGTPSATQTPVFWDPYKTYDPIVEMDIGEIFRMKSQLTDIQFNEYSGEQIGKRVFVRATVRDVDDDGGLYVKPIGLYFFNNISVYGIPMDISLNLNKGDVIEFNAKISSFKKERFAYIIPFGFTIEMIDPIILRVD